MSLRTQILLGYGLVLVLAAAVIAFALASVARLGDASDAILSENYLSIQAAETMADALERQDSAMLLAISGDAGVAQQQLRDNDVRFRRALAVAQGNVTIPDEGAVLDSVAAAYATYAASLQVAGDGAPLDVYLDRLFPAFLRAKTATSRLRDLNQGAMVAASDEAGRVGRRSVLSVGAVAGLTLVLGTGLSLALAGRITRPARQLRAAAEKVAAGDLDAAVPPGRDDELGALASAFNGMTERLRTYRALDVDRLVAEQRKTAAVIEAVDDGLVVVLAGGVVDRINPAAALALGQDAAAVAGRPFAEVAGERLGATVLAALAGEPARPPEFLDSPDGARHYEPVASPVRTPDGDLVGAVLVLRDVTGLHELDRLKSAFVATASHELKTPLTSMGMSVGMLQERIGAALGADDRDLLDTAAEDVERLSALVHDLLDLSRIDAGQLVLRLEAVPVSSFVAPAVRGVRVQAQEAGIELTVRVPDGVPPVRADAPRTAHVLTNLLANALRFTPRGGHVVVSACEAPGDMVEIRVTDDGEGVPLDVQPHLFERFVQAPGEKASGGSGLGLAIAREVVEAHGGTIRVESTPGEGATFAFTLPAAEGHEA